MAQQKMGISLGIKLGELQTIQKDLDKQIAKIKCNLTVDKIEMNTEVLGKKVQSSMNTLAKNIILKISKIEIDENTAFKSQLSKLTKDASIRISNIEINKSATDSIQSKLNSALKGLVVKVGNVEFDVTKIDTLVKKTREAEQEAKKYQETMGKPLNNDMVNNLKEKAIQLKNDLGTPTTTSLNMDGNGGIKDATISYRDNMGKLVTETYKWKQVLESLGDGFGDKLVSQFVKVNTKITESTGALSKVEQKIELIKAKMQGKLDVAKDNDFISGDSLDKIQDKINAIGKGTKPTAIIELQRELDNLSKSDKGISDLQQKIASMESVLNKAKGGDTFNFQSVQGSIKSFESQLQVLRTLENEVFNGKSISSDKISNEIKTMEMASKNLTTSLKEAKTEFNNFTPANKKTLQKQLDKSKDNDVLSVGSLDSLQARLNSINVKTPQVEVEKLEKEINNLASKDKNVRDLQQAITNMGSSLTNIKGNTNSDILGLKNVSGQISAYESKLVELDLILKDVLSGKGVKSGEVQKSIEQMNSLSKALSTSLKEAQSQAGNLSSKMRESLQGKLTTSFNNGFINTSFLTDLQAKLDSINVSSPEKQVNSLIATINGLGKSETSIVKLQRTIVNLSNEINKIKSNKSVNVMNQSEIGRLQTAQAEVSKLRQMLASMQAGKVIDGRLVSSEVNTATNSVRQLKSEVNSVKESAFSLGGALKSMLMFSVGGSAMFAMFEQIRSAVEWVKYLDESFTDMAITMDISRGQFDQMSVSIDNMSQELGVNAKDVHDIARVYANASASVDQILAKVRPDAQLSNVSGINGEEITKTLQTATYAFDMLNKSESNAGEATTHIGDVMTAVSKNMKYDFQSGIQELNGAIKTSGSVAKESGMSLEQYTSYMGAMIERTGKSGEELGTFWKMLTARMQQIKGLGDEMGVSKEDMGKAEKAYQSFGLSIRGSNGTIKDMNTLLQELSPKWATMKDQERSYVAENVAGNRHRATFLSLMKSMTTEQKLYGEAMNSNGALEEAAQKRAESLDGKLNTLKDTMQVLYDTILSGDAMKGGVGLFTGIVKSVTDLTKTFGSIPTVIATVVASMTMLNSSFRASMSFMMPTSLIKLRTEMGNLGKAFTATANTQKTNIAASQMAIRLMNEQGISCTGAKVKLAGYQAGLATATIGTKALAVATVAMEAAFSMGLSLAISYVIEKVMALANAQENLKQANEDFMASSKTAKETIGSSNELLKQKIELEKKISGTNEGTKENKELKEQLLEVERQLATALPGSTTGFDSQGKAISTNNELIKKQIELKKQANIADTVKNIKENAKNDKLDGADGVHQMNTKGFQYNGDFEHVQESLKQAQEEKAKYQKMLSEAGNWFTKTQAQEGLDSSSKIETDALSRVANYKLLILSLKDAGLSYTEIAQKIGFSEEAVRSYTADLEESAKKSKEAGDGAKELGDKTTALSNALGELKDTGSVSQGTIDGLNKLFPDMGINAGNAEAKIKKFNQELMDSSDLVADASKEMDDSNKLSEKTVKKLAAAFPELGIKADNAKDVLGKVADAEKKLGDEAKAAEDKVKKLGDTFSGLGDEAKVIDTIKEEMNNYGGITEETLGTVISKYPELLAVMSQGGDITGNLTKKQEELRAKQEQVKQEAIAGSNELYNTQASNDASSTSSNADANATKSQNNSDYHNNERKNDEDTTKVKEQGNINDANTHAEATGTKSKNSADYHNNERKNAEDTTKEQANQYSNDNTNFDNANQIKELNYQYWIHHLGSALWDWVNNNNTAYGQDAQNWINAQLKKTKTPESSSNMNPNGTPRGLKLDDTEINKIKDEAKKKEDAKKKVANSGSFPVTISTAGAKAMDEASKKAEQDAKKAEQEAEKQAKLAEDIEDMKSGLNIDRYSELEGNIKGYDNALKENKTLQDSLNEGSKEFVDAQNVEIKIYQDKQKALNELNKAQYQEKDELKAKLVQNGFVINSNGKLVDSLKKLKDMEASTDAMRGNTDADKEAKQDAITKVKEVNDWVKRYGDLSDDIIPKTTSEWNELGNEIANVKKKIQDTAGSQLQTLGNDLMDGLKAQITKKEKKAEKADKKAKNSVIDALEKKIAQKKKELKNLDDDSSDKAIKLEKLKQQMALWKQDNSAVSVQKQNDLQNDITDLEKDINKDSVQKELDALDEKKTAKEKHFDEVEQATKDSYDKQLKDQNLYSKASKLIQDGDTDAMLKVLQAKEPDFTNMWKELGKSSVDAYVTEITSGLQGANILGNIAKETKSSNASEKGSDAKGSSSASKDTRTEVKVGDTVKVSNLGADAIKTLSSNGSSESLIGDGASWGSYVDSTTKLKVIGYNNGYFQITEGSTLGWARREDLARFDTGGRVPDNVSSNGVLSILDPGEKIITKKDNTMMDRIDGYVEQTASMLSSVSNMLNDYDNTKDIANVSSSLSNQYNNNQTTNQGNVTINNEFQVTNTSNVKARNTEKNISELITKDVGKFGKRI